MRQHLPPSPALVKATAQALEIFAEHWPRSVAISGTMKRDSVSRDGLILSWARALSGVTLDAIPHAAERWLADPHHAMTNGRTVIPSMAAFVKYARQIDRESFRVGRSTAPLPSGSPGRAQDLARAAKGELREWRFVMEVPQQLITTAEHMIAMGALDKAALTRIRENRFGTLPSDPWPRVEHYMEAVETVRLKHQDEIARAS